eukprot:1001523_1
MAQFVSEGNGTSNEGEVNNEPDEDTPESEIMLWLQKNNLCGKNDSVLNAFRRNVDVELTIDQLFELHENDDLTEFLNSFSISKPAIILISSKIKQIKKLKKQNTNQDNNE